MPIYLIILAAGPCKYLDPNFRVSYLMSPYSAAYANANGSDRSHSVRHFPVDLIGNIET